ncbi:alpha/beta hydrolase [Peristeroidobacter agariperforans]|uniref:alpha/beta hydrolase n=1 Tax=Peristeroidobacter agariperforans TaxID=268404 RepID=UPI0018E4F931|nr:alpha/beta hydrolase [Peristeroidobacter agariperforans]
MSEISRRAMILGAAAGVAATVPLPIQGNVAHATASGASLDATRLIDPQLIGPLEAMMELGGELPNADNLSLLRGRAATWEKRLPAPAPQPKQISIPARGGRPAVTAMLIDPAPNQTGKPALLHMHGGGFVLGSAAMNTAVLQECAQSCGCVIVSVNYRLAPETPFPGSLEDNYAALQWLHANAMRLGVDPLRIGVGGESAGGGCAAVLALFARDRAEIPIRFQLLIYPMLDDRTGSTNFSPAHLGRWVWTEEANRFGWTSYLGVPAGSHRVPDRAVPARSDQLADLPPTFIGVGALDLFALEDIEYAKRLVLAGVPCELHVVPRAYHGFDVLAPEAPISSAFRQTWHKALRRALLES